MTEEVKTAGGDGDYIPRNAQPEVQELDLCSINQMAPICELDRIGAMIPTCALSPGATPFLGTTSKSYLFRHVYNNVYFR